MLLRERFLLLANLRPSGAQSSFASYMSAYVCHNLVVENGQVFISAMPSSSKTYLDLIVGVYGRHSICRCLWRYGHFLFT